MSSGVSPSLLALSTSAPAARRVSTTSKCPFRTALINGESWPPLCLCILFLRVIRFLECFFARGFLDLLDFLFFFSCRTGHIYLRIYNVDIYLFQRSHTRHNIFDISIMIHIISKRFYHICFIFSW